MAKVYMPLMSARASGKIAKSMVHFYWKGLNVVRNWVIPTNPRDIDQKIIRQKLASAGKNLKVITRATTTHPNGSKMYVLLKAEAPANAIWNAHFVKQVLNHVKTDSNFTAMSSALFACADTKGVWNLNAVALGMETLTGAAYATSISPELQLFMGAYSAYKLNLSSDTDVYSTYPSNWVTAAISNFATDYYTN